MRGRAWFLAFAGVMATAPAYADPLRFHGETGAAHALGDPQAYEFGFGAHGNVAIEVPVSRETGVQIEAGALWLSHANPPTDPTIADHGDGTALSAMLGLRVRPFTEVAGPWIDANAGYVHTGGLDRFGFDAHAGYDWRVGGGRWDAGPYLGYLEVVQPSDVLRPEDAHVISIGIHVALGVERRVAAAPPPPPPEAPKPPPSPPPPDRDKDGIADAEDACPDVPGVRTSDPKTNGCPPDRDKDGIPDAEDACPDVPGVRTSDPKTNGCPPAGDEVRVVKDRIEYDEVIQFDTDSAHVHHASWPILQKLAKFINANPGIEQVDISGHADERGTEAHNLQLSKSRAEAVKDLLGRFGVDPSRLTTFGYGYSRPRAQGHTEAEWRQNRRVEFIITKVKNAQGKDTTLPQPGVHDDL